MNFKKILFFVLVPFLFVKAHHDDDHTTSYNFSNHRKYHNVNHSNRAYRRQARRHHHDDDYDKHRYHRVGGRTSSQQSFPERVAQPVVTAGGTAVDVAEDVVELRPGEAVEDAVRGTGETVKDVVAIPFGGRARRHDYRD